MYDKQKVSAAAERLFILLLLWACAGFIYKFLPNAARIIPAAGLASAVLLLTWFFPEKARRAGELCFRYRWALALLVFLLCVVLRLHGSSIGVYDEVFPTQISAEETTLFGQPRWIRSDEFGVTTPTYFSQAANGYRLYSGQMSLSPTNMVLDYYSPVWDWTILGKPLSWGFLLFGSEVGLSWYWCGEILLLFMTALEMCLILTEGMRRESLIGAVMIALSPAIQWWVMPHMPPVILYAMALFCIGYRFFTANTLSGKWGSAALACIAAIGFVLSIFPSFQIPCAYTVLILLIVCLRRDREEISFTRRDWLRIALPAAAALVILGRFLLLSRDDLSLLLNTVYPGRRMSPGGGYPVSVLFTDLTSFFLPYGDVSFSNNCEVATYVHFAPLFLALSPYLLPALKKARDKNWIVGAALGGILLVQAVYLLMGFPKWLAEITLLRFCNRMHEVYGWVAVLFTVWGLSVLARRPALLRPWARLLLPLLCGAASLLVTDQPRREYFAQFVFREIPLGTLLTGLTLAGIICILYFALFRRRSLMSAALILAMLFCGATVNPIERGIGAVTNHPISAAVSEIAGREPESRWLCTNTSFILSNYLMANGAKVLNATNFYPDVEKWSVLDPDGQYAEITNRYANQSAVFTEEETSAESPSPDHVRLRLNPESLKDLGIDYLLSPVDHTELLNRYGIGCEYVTGQDGYGIYRITYDS